MILYIVFGQGWVGFFDFDISILWVLNFFFIFQVVMEKLFDLVKKVIEEVMVSFVYI